MPSLRVGSPSKYTYRYCSYIFIFNEYKYLHVGMWIGSVS